MAARVVIYVSPSLTALHTATRTATTAAGIARVVTRATPIGTARTRVTNRGRTAAGVYCYWYSWDTVDTAKAYYTGTSPPKADIIEVVGIGAAQVPVS